MLELLSGNRARLELLSTGVQLQKAVSVSQLKHYRFREGGRLDAMVDSNDRKAEASTSDLERRSEVTTSEVETPADPQGLDEAVECPPLTDTDTSDAPVGDLGEHSGGPTPTHTHYSVLQLHGHDYWAPPSPVASTTIAGPDVVCTGTTPAPGHRRSPLPVHALKPAPALGPALYDVITGGKHT